MLCGAAAMAWGGYVLTQATPLDHLPAYELLDWLPPHAWGGVSMLLGMGQCAAGLAHLHGWRWVRSAAAWAMLLWWKVLAVALFKSDVPVPAGAVYCVLALVNVPVIVLLLPGFRLCRRS